MAKKRSGNSSRKSSQDVFKKHPNLKMLLLLLLLSALVFFFLKNNYSTMSTPPSAIDQTASWKTYTANGIEFKYPSTYEVLIDDPNGKKNPKIIRVGETYVAKGLYIDWEPYFGDKGTRQDNFDLTLKEAAGAIHITRTLIGKDIYFGCQFNDDKSEIDTCNQILSTFQFSN